MSTECPLVRGLCSKCPQHLVRAALWSPALQTCYRGSKQGPHRDLLHPPGESRAPGMVTVSISLPSSGMVVCAYPAGLGENSPKHRKQLANCPQEPHDDSCELCIIPEAPGLYSGNSEPHFTLSTLPNKDS